MKHLFYAIIILFFSACAGGGTSDGNGKEFGEKFDAKHSVEMSALISSMADGKQKDFVVKGKITSVCKKKGCWMELDKGNDETMRVTFKDYGFFVPLDAEGREVIIKGFASVNTISVDDLKHYAEDAGKTSEEIEAITQPELELVFEATGVLFVD